MDRKIANIAEKCQKIQIEKTESQLHRGVQVLIFGDFGNALIRLIRHSSVLRFSGWSVG
jgi:hypothetical protein